MSISGYIIEKYNTMTNAYTCKRLVSEGKTLGMDTRIVGVHDCLVSQSGIINCGELLQSREFVINRYKWGKIKEEINGLAERTYNPIEAYDVYINKYEQVKRLSSDAFLVPKFLLGTSLMRYEVVAECLGKPFVAKGLESSMGAEIRLIEKETDFQELKTLYGTEKEWLFEEYIADSAGKDMRFYSIRGEAVACMVRKSEGDFRANVALGAQVEAMNVNDSIRKIAKDIYAITGLDFLGIDLLFGKEKPYFCEINVMPGIEGIEKATGVNVAAKIMETIKRDFES